MIEIKSQSSKSYHEYLISSLQNSERAASNIEVALEVEDFDPEVLKITMKDVVEAHSKINGQSEILNQKYEKLENILTELKGVEINSFIELLNVLGFQLNVNPKNT